MLLSIWVEKELVKRALLALFQWIASRKRSMNEFQTFKGRGNYVIKQGVKTMPRLGTELPVEKWSWND